MFAKENGKGLAAVWFKFFLDAGIPPSDAGNYAATFTEHRIQSDMLGELTKDYLADMGIKVLGDIIAILKHARIEHAKMSKEQALKCSGLAVQSLTSSASLSSASVPPATKTLPATTKRTNAKAAAAVAASSGPVATSSLQIVASKNSTRSTGVGFIVVDEPRRSKMPAATVLTAAAGATRGAKVQRPQEKQPVQGALTSRFQTVNKGSLTAGSQKSSLVLAKPSIAGVRSQSGASVNDLTLTKSIVAVPSSSLTMTAAAASSKMTSSSVFSRLGDKLSTPSPSRSAIASSADKTVLTKTVRDRLGPATHNTGTESAASSVMSRLGDSQPALLIPTNRKLVGETVTLTAAMNAAAAAAAAAAAVPTVGPKSSIKSRLGEPVTRDPQPGLTIPTKRKPTDETVSSATAEGMQAKSVKLSAKLSVKSRLGELSTSEFQPKLKVPINREVSAGDDNDQPSCVVLPQYKTVFSRLGHV